VTPSTANFLFITYKLKKLLCNFQLICVTYSTTHCFSFIISYKLNKFSALLLFNAHLHIENFFHSFVLTNICCSPPLLIFFSIGSPLQIHQILLFVYLCLFPFFRTISDSSYFIYSLFWSIQPIFCFN
jgi:hypothetical protein